jgi:hypothetical protein
MKNTLVLSTIAACALAAPVASAQDKHAHDKPAASVGNDNYRSQMQEKMKAMQAQMDTIRTVTDPAVRQRLIQEHMQAMQENMKAMRGMGGGMMMGGKKDGMKDGGMMKHHAMMENRMEMMQMMMEQMMQRDQMMQQMPGK